MNRNTTNSNRVVYTDNPEMGDLIEVVDTLPSPAEFRKAREAQEQIEITLSLSRAVVLKVKKEARKQKSDYKTYLQHIISTYTDRQRSSAS